jgi:LmbE family N-acetylglucosaminyl deacetylase
MAGRPWILVVPHPDDEVLGAGVTIAEHVAAGRDVQILLLTRGTNSGARDKINGDRWSPWWGVAHDPVAEGYTPLDQDQFGAARFSELVVALSCLGVGSTQIHEVGLLDGQVTVAAVKTAIAGLVAQLGSASPGVYAPSFVVDDNADHRAGGQALRELGTENPTLYADRRWYILPAYWSDSRLTQVNEFWDYPTDTAISNRARNACRANGAWHPPDSYAIGYHSVDTMFAAIDTNPRSLLHK